MYKKIVLILSIMGFFTPALEAMQQDTNQTQQQSISSSHNVISTFFSTPEYLIPLAVISGTLSLLYKKPIFYIPTLFFAATSVYIFYKNSSCYKNSSGQITTQQPDISIDNKKQEAEKLEKNNVNNQPKKTPEKRQTNDNNQSPIIDIQEQLDNQIDNQNQDNFPITDIPNIPNQISGDNSKKIPVQQPIFYQRVAYDITPLNSNHNITLFVTYGDMLLQGADVVVDAANAGLNTGAGVTGALQNAFRTYLHYTGKATNNWLHVWKKERILSKQGNLQIGHAWLNGPEVQVIPVNHQKTPAMRIIHVVAPQNAHATNQNDPKWKQLYNCFYTALQEADRGNFKRIAFPVLGSGIYNCASNVVAHAAVRAIKDYVNQIPNSQITEIHLTALDNNRYIALKNEIRAFMPQLPDNTVKK